MDSSQNPQPAPDRHLLVAAVLSPDAPTLPPPSGCPCDDCTQDGQR